VLLAPDWRRALLEGQRAVRLWWPLELPKASTGSVSGALGSLFGGKSKKAAATSDEAADGPEVLLELRWAFNADLVESEDEESEDEESGAVNALGPTGEEVPLRDFVEQHLYG
jgi:hypothetical protein